MVLQEMKIMRHAVCVYSKLWTHDPLSKLIIDAMPIAPKLTSTIGWAPQQLSGVAKSEQPILKVEQTPSEPVTSSKTMEDLIKEEHRKDEERERAFKLWSAKPSQPVKADVFQGSQPGAATDVAPTTPIIEVKEDDKSDATPTSVAETEIGETEKDKQKAQSRTIKDLQNNEALKNLQTDAKVSTTVEMTTDKEYPMIGAATKAAARNKAPIVVHKDVTAEDFKMYQAEHSAMRYWSASNDYEDQFVPFVRHIMSHHELDIFIPYLKFLTPEELKARRALVTANEGVNLINKASKGPSSSQPGTQQGAPPSIADKIKAIFVLLMKWLRMEKQKLTRS